jgi:phenylpyruvate tautomerase PptA (4-oxalocrotonate tautomerase family)
MPEVYIYVAEGRSIDQKRKVAREMTEVLRVRLKTVIREQFA